MEEDVNFSRDRIVRTFFLVLMILAAASGLKSQTTANLKEIALQKDGDRLNVLLKIEGTFTVEASFLPAPPRLVVDLTPMTQIQVQPYTQIDDIGVLDIRTGQYTPETARIVFDLGENFPAYNIVQNAEGLKVSFWYEGEVPPLEAPVREEVAKPAEKPAPPVETPREPRVPGLSNYFVSARAGLSLFLSSDFAARKDFALYGETGTLDEAYSFKTAPSFELQFGKYFGRTKIGVGVASWSIKEPGIFTAALPHPFLADAFRTVTFEASDMKYPAWNFSAFALFSILEMDKISLSGGPMLGLTTGQIRSLDDFSFAEKSPFAATDVTISNLTYIEQKFTELLFGGLLSLEYRAMPQLSVLFDLRMIYLNPKNVALGQRINFLHFQPILGIQYNF
jgi:hypothetical protein